MEFGHDSQSNNDSFEDVKKDNELMLQRASMPEFGQNTTKMQLIDPKDQENPPPEETTNNLMSVSTRLKFPKRRRSNDGRYTRCIAIQKHPINLLIERFVKLLDATYAERLRKLGLYVGQELRKRRT